MTPNMASITNGPLPVAPGDSLWRYVSLPALLFYLDGKLRLPSVQELRRMDPQEGNPSWDHITQTRAFTDKEYGRVFDYVESRLSENDRSLFVANRDYPGANQRVVFQHWQQLVATTRYALCFFLCPHESIAMWRLFAPKGFALRTSLAALESALKPTERNWRISKMQYWDKSREITPDDTYRTAVLKETLRHPYLLKGREYQYENEVRLCTVDGRARPTLVVEGVCAEAWIQEIRISPEIWCEDAEILRKLICERCPALKDRFGHSPLSTAPSDSEASWSRIESRVCQEDADKNWPDFLHEP